MYDCGSSCEGRETIKKTPIDVPKLLGDQGSAALLSLRTCFVTQIPLRMGNIELLKSNTSCPICQVCPIQTCKAHRVPVRPEGTSDAKPF